MVDQHWWSANLPLTIWALAFLAAWPFRRNEASESDDTQNGAGEETASPEIDHFDWGIRLGMLERYERAADQFRTAAEAHPDDPAIHYNLALALDLAGHHDEARCVYEHVLAIAPDAVDARVNLGLMLFECGDTAGAWDTLKTALRESPDDATVHYDLGCLHLAQKRWSDAALEFRASVDAAPKDPQARFNLAIALHRAGRRVDAEQEMREFLEQAHGRYPEQRGLVEELLRDEYADTGDGNGS